jgi:hypothetical protein
MSTFLLNEMSDNFDASLVESARLVKPVMWASEPAKVGIASAVDITKILWHEEFDDTKTIDGKKFGRDCKQIWDTACTNPHMMPAWWNATVPGVFFFERLRRCSGCSGQWGAGIRGLYILRLSTLSI